jgi:hypothetical protein
MAKKLELGHLLYIARMFLARLMGWRIAGIQRFSLARQKRSELKKP